MYLMLRMQLHMLLFPSVTLAFVHRIVERTQILQIPKCIVLLFQNAKQHQTFQIAAVFT